MPSSTSVRERDRASHRFVIADGAVLHRCLSWASREPLEHEGHAIVVVRRRDLVGYREHLRMRIRDGHAVPRPHEHGQVVWHVSERDHLLARDAMRGSVRFDRQRLNDARSGHLDELRSRVGDTR